MKKYNAIATVPLDRELLLLYAYLKNWKLTEALHKLDICICNNTAIINNVKYEHVYTF